MKGLKGIYVRSFEFSKAAQYSAADVEAIRSQLRGANWKSIVEVHSKNDGDNADVYVTSKAITSRGSPSSRLNPGNSLS